MATVTRPLFSIGNLVSGAFTYDDATLQLVSVTLTNLSTRPAKFRCDKGAVKIVPLQDFTGAKTINITSSILLQTVDGELVLPVNIQAGH